VTILMSFLYLRLEEHNKRSTINNDGKLGLKVDIM